ncbi:MAG: hypothetical protein C0481_20075 [Phenylobacterium sp.]|nr:hypothetical protein [Phenylobacterium sp.]
MVDASAPGVVIALPDSSFIWVAAASAGLVFLAPSPAWAAPASSAVAAAAVSRVFIIIVIASE